MNKEQVQEKSKEKVKAIETLCKQLEIVVTAEQVLTPQGFIKQISPDKILRFTSKGTLTPRNDLFPFMNENPDQNILVIMGGFQTGSYSQAITDIEAQDLAIYPESLETNTVLNHIIINFEHAIGI